MYGNGVVIGTVVVITVKAPVVTPVVQVAGLTASRVAVAGATMRGTAALPIASTATRRTATSILAFVWVYPSSSAREIAELYFTG